MAAVCQRQSPNQEAAMAEPTLSHAGSAEAIAYRLLLGIAISQNKAQDGIVVADKEWILKTYAQCFMVTRAIAAAEALKRE
jgi:hypothetical protein